MKAEYDRTLALAGIYQAASLVAQVARQGHCSGEAKKASLFSLLQVDAESTAAVYGGLKGLELGLLTLYRQLTDSAKGDLDVTRYAIQLIQMNGALGKRPPMLATISEGLKEAEQRKALFGLTHPNTIAHFADIYTRTISTLQPRILVHGDPTHLNNPDNANQIRTFLLAGIRSAMLWRQCGGNRFQILFGRNRISRLVQQLLDDLEGESAPG